MNRKNWEPGHWLALAGIVATLITAVGVAWVTSRATIEANNDTLAEAEEQELRKVLSDAAVALRRGTFQASTAVDAWQMKGAPLKPRETRELDAALDGIQANAGRMALRLGSGHRAHLCYRLTKTPTTSEADLVPWLKTVVIRTIRSLDSANAQIRRAGEVLR